MQRQQSEEVQATEPKIAKEANEAKQAEAQKEAPVVSAWEAGEASRNELARSQVRAPTVQKLDKTQGEGSVTAGCPACSGPQQDAYVHREGGK